MPGRYTRAARRRVKPGRSQALPIAIHFGDDFDEVAPSNGQLHVIPIRDYVPKVPQEFDDFIEFKDEFVGPVNQTGPLFEGAEPVVCHAHNYESYLAAFNKRANSQPAASEDLDPHELKQACEMWANCDVEFEPFDVDDALFERWLKKFDENKQKRMVKANRELFEADEPGYLGQKQLQVKPEALLKRYSTDWAPRLIYAGNDHFNALTGPVAMVLCERLDELFQKTTLGSVKFMFAYKKTDLDLARHIDESRFTNGAEGDFSSNDLYQRKGVVKLFDAFCAKVGAPSWFRQLLSDMRVFTTKNFEFGHTAKLENQLPTGTTITTPRNTVLDATIFARYCNNIKAKADAVTLGDDLSAMVSKEVNCDHWTEWVYDKWRMKLKGKKPSPSGEMTFLSRRFCMYGSQPCMMPLLGKALARFNVRVSANQALTDSAYMAGKALSYAYEFRHFPLFRDLFLTRYGMEEDKENLDWSELSWFTRNSGIDMSQLQNHIASEKVVMSEDSTREFIMDSYGDDAWLSDALEMARLVILSTEHVSLVPPKWMAIDW